MLFLVCLFSFLKINTGESKHNVQCFLSAHTNTHKHTCTHARMQACARTHTQTHARMQACAHTHTHTLSLNTLSLTTNTYTHMHVIHTHTCICNLYWLKGQFLMTLDQVKLLLYTIHKLWFTIALEDHIYKHQTLKLFKIINENYIAQGRKPNKKHTCKTDMHTGMCIATHAGTYLCTHKQTHTYICHIYINTHVLIHLNINTEWPDKHTK